MHSNNQMYYRKRQYGDDYPKQNNSFQKNPRTTTRDFSHLYDSGPGASYDRTSTPNKKRPKINAWDTPFTSNHGNQNSSYMGQRMSPPKPLMSIKPTNQTVNRKYYTQKPSNSMMQAPVVPKNRPKKKPAIPPNESVEAYILRTDQVPNHVLTSRLEAGMGAVLKEIKEKCTVVQNNILFKSIHLQKLVKQSIRERLKKAMLNKFVGKVVDIVEMYRKMFTLKSDMDMFAKILAKADTESKELSENFDSKLAKNLNVMFEKVLKMWTTSCMDVLDIVEADEIAENGDKSIADIKHSSKIRLDFYKSIVDSLIMKRLPILLPKYRTVMLKILEEEPVTEHNKSVIAIEPEEPKTIDIHDSDSEIENVVEGNTDALNNEEENKLTVSEKETIADDQSKESPEESNAGEKDNANAIPKDTVADAQNLHTVDTVADAQNLPDSEMAEDCNVELEKQTKTNDAQASSLYLVKVLSQPDLPSKADTYKFLNQFNPVSVKKHKVIQNLLVVSFKEVKDFNNILAATGTVIGKSRLIIKGNKAQQPLASTPVTSNETKVDECDLSKNESSSENVLSPDLENQITDLLSSIRKADEQENETSISDVSKMEEDTAVTVAQKDNRDDTEIKEVANIETESTLDNVENEEQTDSIPSEENADKQPDLETDNTKEENEAIEEMDTNTYSPSKSSGDSTVNNIKEEAKENDEEETNESEIVCEAGSDTTESNQDSKMTPKRSTRLTAATPSSVTTRRATRQTKQ